jgi:hypothetical protein
MKYRLIGNIEAVAAVSSLLVVFVVGRSQNAAQNKTAFVGPSCIGCSVDGKTTPRTADGHPDLSGFWGGGPDASISTRSDDGSALYDFQGEDPSGQFVHRGEQPQLPNQPPYRPEYMEKVNAIGATMYGGTSALDPQFACKPGGIPRAAFGEMQIVQTPLAIAMLHGGESGGGGTTDRIIYMDGRPHPADLESSYMGDSIGRWEGDTLVVDVTGLNDETWLGGSVNGNTKFTTIHSDQEHVIERWTRRGDELTYEATVEDPVMFTKPWVTTPRRIRHAKAGQTDYLISIPDNCERLKEEMPHIVQPTDKDHFSCIYCVPGEPQAAGAR